MMVTNKEMKQVLKINLKSIGSVEQSSLKFLDMMGWLIRSVNRNDIDLASVLTGLGKLHQSMGININHFHPMLNSMHEAFSYYFPIKYGIEVCLTLYWLHF